MFKSLILGFSLLLSMVLNAENIANFMKHANLKKIGISKNLKLFLAQSPVPGKSVSINSLNDLTDYVVIEPSFTGYNNGDNQMSNFDTKLNLYSQIEVGEWLDFKFTQKEIPNIDPADALKAIYNTLGSEYPVYQFSIFKSTYPMDITYCFNLKPDVATHDRGFQMLYNTRTGEVSDGYLAPDNFDINQFLRVNETAYYIQNYLKDIKTEIDKGVRNLETKGMAKSLNPANDPKSPFVNTLLPYLPYIAQTGTYSLKNELSGCRDGILLYNSTNDPIEKKYIGYQLCETVGELSFYIETYLAQNNEGSFSYTQTP